MLNKFALLGVMCALSACGASSQSVAWNFAENDSFYGNAELTTARLQCAQGGFDGAGFDACVQNSMRY